MTGAVLALPRLLCLPSTPCPAVAAIPLLSAVALRSLSRTLRMRRGGRLLPGGATSSSDVELGTLTGRLSSMAPSWVAKADRLKQEMAVLKQRLDKLKE